MSDGSFSLKVYSRDARDQQAVVADFLDRAERAAAWSHGHPLGVAPLPGSERVYEPLRKIWETPSSPNAPSYLPFGGGWLVGIRRGLDGPKRAAALDFAREAGIPDLTIPTQSDPEAADLRLAEALEAAGVELVVLSGYLRRLGPVTLGRYRNRILNIHPGPLPAFGGAFLLG